MSGHRCNLRGNKRLHNEDDKIIKIRQRVDVISKKCNNEIFLK